MSGCQELALDFSASLMYLSIKQTTGDDSDSLQLTLYLDCGTHLTVPRRYEKRGVMAGVLRHGVW